MAGADASPDWYESELALGVENCIISDSDRVNIRVESVVLDRKSVTLTAGQATQLVPAVSPAHAYNRAVHWKSSNPKVVSADEDGWITAKKKGSCRITCITDDGRKKASCKVTVKKAPKTGSIKALSLSKSSISIYTGQKKQLAAKLKTPLHYTPLTWTSSNPGVASVDANGTVTGLRGGSAVITARSQLNGRTAKCKVKVKTKYSIVRLPWQIRRASTVSSYSAQGSGVNNGTYFKLWNYNTIQLYDFSSGALKGEFRLSSRHGNLIDFDTASAPRGPYHDAYITAETNPAMVNVYQFTDTSAKRLRTYIFPLEKTGYNAGHVLDPAKRLIYLVGYTKNSFYNPAGNEMIVSVWDITSTTTVREGFLMPRFVRSFRLPFMLTLQGECLRDNKLYIMSSDWRNPQTVIDVVDLGSSSVTDRIEYLPAELKNLEMESIFFLGNALYIDKNQYLYRLPLYTG